MKKLLSILIAVLLLTVAIAPSAIAGDVTNGARVFSANCASCHTGGKNVVQPNKNLQKATLEKYNMYSSAAIVTQVTQGKGAMPAFGKRLNIGQVEDVAAYVLAQADKDWKP